jgi:hypothetical protein
MAGRSRNKKIVSVNFFFELRQAKRISARSDSGSMRRGRERKDSIHLDLDDLSRELSPFVDSARGKNIRYAANG